MFRTIIERTIMNLISCERISEDVEFSVRITCVIREQVSTVSTLSRCTFRRRGVHRTTASGVLRPYTTAHDVDVLDIVFQVRIWHHEERKIRMRSNDEYGDWTFRNFIGDYFLCRWLLKRSVSSVPLKITKTKFSFLKIK